MPGQDLTWHNMAQHNQTELGSGNHCDMLNLTKVCTDTVTLSQWISTGSYLEISFFFLLEKGYHSAMEIDYLFPMNILCGNILSISTQISLGNLLEICIKFP